MELRVIKQCLNCGKELNVLRSDEKRGMGKYCSRKCRDDHKRTGDKRINRICLNCEKEFYPLLSEVKRGGGKYCSRECLFASSEFRIKQSETKRGEKNHNYGKHQSPDCIAKRVAKIKGRHHTAEQRAKISRAKTGPVEIRSCQHCGNNFNVRPSESDKKYCSNACSNASIDHRNKLSKSHKGQKAWNKGKHPKPESVAKMAAKHRGKHQSPETIAKRVAKIKGPLNSNWKGGISFEPYCQAFTRSLKESVREQFGRKCYLCGETENGERLSVHHCDYNKSQGCKGMKWSLIPLCRKCHGHTQGNRYHWFALLRDYWIYEHLDFNNNRWFE